MLGEYNEFLKILVRGFFFFLRFAFFFVFFLHFFLEQIKRLAATTVYFLLFNTYIFISEKKEKKKNVVFTMHLQNLLYLMSTMMEHPLQKDYNIFKKKRVDYIIYTGRDQMKTRLYLWI